MKKLLRWLGEQLIGNALQQAFELGRQMGAAEERVRQLTTTIGECVQCERYCTISTHSRLCEGCTLAVQMGEDQ